MKNILIPIILLLLVSCSHNRKSYWLEKANSYLYYKPDSTHYFLNKIRNPEKLKDKDWADYHVIRGLQLIQFGTGDSVVLVNMEKGINILIEQNKNKVVEHALYRLGEYYMRYGYFEKADSILHRSLDFSESIITKHIIYQTIGLNYYYASSYEKATFYYSLILNETTQDELHKQIDIYAYMAMVYNQTNQPDSSFLYINNALRLCEENDINYSVSWLYKLRSEINLKYENTNDALRDIQQSIDYEFNRNTIPGNMLTKGLIHLHMGQLDSAGIYFQKVIQSPNEYLSSQAYKYLADLYEVAGKDRPAITTLDLYKKNIDHLKGKYRIGEANYKADILEHEINELNLVRKQQRAYIIICFILLLLLLTMVYIIYMHIRGKQLQKEEETKQQLLKSQITYLEQEKQIILLKERTTALREQLFRRLSAVDKIPSLNGIIHKDQDTNKSRISKQELEELKEMIDTIYPGFTNYLMNTYPLLKPNDILFCCLIKCGISTKDLAGIYYVTPSAISQKKARLKKEKFIEGENQSTLEEILDQF